MPRGNPSPAKPFTSETAPRTGRKKGAVSNSTLKRKVSAELDGMLGQAYKNVKSALRKGNIGVSTWLIDTVRKQESDAVEPGLLEPLAQALETLDDVEQISKQAVLLAIKGDMTFSQLKAVQEALARHSVLRGVIELGKLREEMEALRSAEMGSRELGTGHIPSWGRLKDVTPMLNGNGHDHAAE